MRARDEEVFAQYHAARSVAAPVAQAPAAPAKPRRPRPQAVPEFALPRRAAEHLQPA
ncbi:hypothetical protein [Hymenobacter saemangeumensis]|uniref:hypothetical protein n=1 Tax=Hymenobacter saemangeumensis TaxID=1084522 RepID=UPI0031E962CD